MSSVNPMGSVSMAADNPFIDEPKIKMGKTTYQEKDGKFTLTTKIEICDDAGNKKNYTITYKELTLDYVKDYVKNKLGDIDRMSKGEIFKAYAEKQIESDPAIKGMIRIGHAKIGQGAVKGVSYDLSNKDLTIIKNKPGKERRTFNNFSGNPNTVLSKNKIDAKIKFYEVLKSYLGKETYKMVELGGLESIKNIIKDKGTLTSSNLKEIQKEHSRYLESFSFDSDLDLKKLDEKIELLENKKRAIETAVKIDDWRVEMSSGKAKEIKEPLMKRVSDGVKSFFSSKSSAVEELIEDEGPEEVEEHEEKTLSERVSALAQSAKERLGRVAGDIRDVGTRAINSIAESFMGRAELMNLTDVGDLSEDWTDMELMNLTDVGDLSEGWTDTEYLDDELDDGLLED